MCFNYRDASFHRVKCTVYFLTWNYLADMSLLVRCPYLGPVLYGMWNVLSKDTSWTKAFCRWWNAVNLELTLKMCFYSKYPYLGGVLSVVSYSVAKSANGYKFYILATFFSGMWPILCILQYTHMQ